MFVLLRCLLPPCVRASCARTRTHRAFLPSAVLKAATWTRVRDPEARDAPTETHMAMFWLAAAILGDHKQFVAVSARVCVHARASLSVLTPRPRRLRVFGLIRFVLGLRCCLALSDNGCDLIAFQLTEASVERDRTWAVVRIGVVWALSIDGSATHRLTTLWLPPSLHWPQGAHVTAVGSTDSVDPVNMCLVIERQLPRGRLPCVCCNCL